MDVAYEHVVETHSQATDKQLRIRLCEALSWHLELRDGWKQIRNARWKRERWASSMVIGQNRWRWCLSWYNKRANFGQCEWAETVTDPREALMQAFADLAVDPTAWSTTS